MSRTLPWATLRVGLPLLLASGLADAQPPRPGPVPPQEPGPAPRLVVPGGVVQAPAGSEEALLRSSEGTVRLLKRLGALGEKDPRAQELSALFLGLGPQLPERVGPYLRSADGVVRRGALAVLKALGSPAGAEPIRQALQAGACKGDADAALRAALALDPGGTRPFLWAALESPHGPLRSGAESLLRGGVLPGDLEVVGSLVGSARPDTRVRVLRILSQAGLAEAAPILVEALRDKESQAARVAIQGLARLEPFPAAARALAASFPKGGRPAAFALVAALMAEDRGRQALDPDWAPQLTAALDLSDPFLRGAAAAALARLSFSSSELTGEPFQDLRSMENLVQLLAGAGFFPEYAILLEPAERSARLLSGRAGAISGREWAEWWQTRKEAFLGCRAALPLEDAVHRRRTAVVMEDGVESLAVRAEELRWLAPPGVQEIRVAAAEQEGLIQELLDRGLLERARQNPPGLSTAASPGHARLSLWLEGRELRLIAPAGAEWWERLAAPVKDTVERNLWQLFGPGPGPAGEAWRAEQARFFAGAAPAARQERLKGLVLARLPDLDGVRRVRALAYLLAIPDLVDLLTEADVAGLLAGISRSKGLDETAAAVVEVAALARAAGAWDRVLPFLVERWSEGGSAVLPRLLQRASPARLQASLSHPEAVVRAAAARFVGSRQERVWVPRLAELTVDPAPAVRAAAVWALARTGDTSTLPRILLMSAKETDPEVLREILLYAGESREPAALPTLIRGLQVDVPSLRLASVQALGRSRLPQAADVLAGLVMADVDGPAGREAAAVLTGWGGPHVRAAVRLLLRSPQPKVREQATWILASALDAGVLPTLVEWLRDPALARQARFYLVLLTCTDFPQDPAAGFAQWLEENGGRPEGAWFVRELKAAGYPVTFDAPDLLPGAGLGAARELVAVLRGAREWWFRVQAARRLQELAGKDFGEVGAEAPRETLEAVATAWLGWLEARAGKDEADQRGR